MLQLKNYYLDLEKTFRKSMDQYLESTPLPSKKDIARVARLVINVEDKVESLELNIEKKLDRLIDSLSIIVDSFSKQQEKSEYASRQANEFESIDKRLSILLDKIEGISGQISSNQAPGKKNVTSRNAMVKPDKNLHKPETAIILDETSPEEVKKDDTTN